MEGFDLFTKDTSRLKTLYWKVLNYLFLSPFIAKLRYEDRFFPMYMLIYGDSDAGKTGFINLTRPLMFNEKMNVLTQDYFSSKPMTSLKSDVKGCPVLIDELTPTYWKYAKDILKMDVNLIRECLINHPIFVLLSNDINNVDPELSKRIIVINLNNRLDRTAAAYNGKKINTIRKLRILHDELPADVECKIVGTKAVLKLDAIKKHSAINFKKKPFRRR